jgi:hypothetical protein
MKSMRDEFVRGLRDVEDEVRRATGDVSGGGEPGARRKQE